MKDLGLLNSRRSFGRLGALRMTRRDPLCNRIETMDKNNRKQKRLDARLFTELTSPTSGNSLGRGVVLNVSLSGVGIESEADLSINENVTCHIEVPVQLEAKVVRISGEGQVKRFGLKFKNQSIFDKLVFKRVLKGSLQTRKLSQ